VALAAGIEARRRRMLRQRTAPELKQVAAVSVRVPVMLSDVRAGR
jgi:hypothetical protein